MVDSNTDIKKFNLLLCTVKCFQNGSERITEDIIVLLFNMLLEAKLVNNNEADFLEKKRIKALATLASKNLECAFKYFK